MASFGLYITAFKTCGMLLTYCMHFTPRRIGKAIPAVTVITILALIATFYTNVRQSAMPSTPTGNANQLLLWPYFVVGFTALLAVALQTWANLVTGVFNSNLVLKYQDLFESKKIRKSRATAAREFKSDNKYSPGSREIETVLDVFEDIGFYVKHDEMSVEVAHHHFYYWIRGYVQTAGDYIDDYRREDETAYEHCAFLLKAVSQFEAKKLKTSIVTLRWNEKDIADFLEDEIEEDASDN